jgi:hypothetical protein
MDAIVSFVLLSESGQELSEIVILSENDNVLCAKDGPKEGGKVSSLYFSNCIEKELVMSIKDCQMAAIKVQLGRGNNFLPYTLKASVSF